MRVKRLIICFNLINKTVLGFVIAVWSVAGIADTSSSTFNFTAIFVGGSCEISAPTSIQFNDGEALRPSEIEQGIAATTQSFNLILSKCSGWGLTPSVKVNGQKTSDFGPALFRNTLGAMDSNGYGILLATDGNTSFVSNPNLAATGTILAKNWNPESQLDSIDIRIPIVAKLTCGNCDYVGRQSGAFKATVTFDFVYE